MAGSVEPPGSVMISITCPAPEVSPEGFVFDMPAEAGTPAAPPDSSGRVWEPSGMVSDSLETAWDSSEMLSEALSL